MLSLKQHSMIKIFAARADRVIPSVLVSASLLFLLAGASALHAPAQELAEDPVAIFNAGQDAHEKGDLVKAVEYYLKAIEAAKEFPEAEFQLGNAYRSMGKADLAEAAFRKAVELRPDWSLALATLGDCLVRKLASADDKQKAAIRSEAERLLDRAVETDPENSVAISAMAEIALLPGSSESRRRQLYAEIKTMTDGKMSAPASLWTARSGLEIAFGDRAAARASLRRALSADPRSPEALTAAIRLALSDGDTDRAAAMIDDLETISSDRSAVLLLRFDMLLRRGNIDDAAALARNEGVAPSDRQVMTTALASLRKLSVADLEAAIRSDPNDASARAALCAEYRTSDPAKAIEHCRRASELEPNNVSHIVGYAAALLQAKRPEQAIEILVRVIKVMPDNATAHANLAAALFQTKRYAEARDQYRWLIDHGTGLPIAYYLAAITHDQLGEYLDAMANYQLFLKYADAQKHAVEIGKVNLRLPAVQKLARETKGKN